MVRHHLHYFRLVVKFYPSPYLSMGRGTMNEKKEVDKNSLDYVLFGDPENSEPFMILLGSIGWFVIICIIFGCC